MNPVSIVTIKNKIPLFKGEEEASSIELIELEEVGYELVANKSLYKIGDKAVLIQPDYNLSDISLFESFLRPNGQENKSMLGKVEGLPRRIRAKKFTLSKQSNGDPVYSNGILLPWKEVQAYLDANKSSIYKLSLFLNDLDLTKELGITKYEEPEIGGFGKGGARVGQIGGKFPEGVYKTDEENINNLWNHVESHIGYPVTLIGTEKIDGSSITIGVKDGKGFICSRNINKKLTINKLTGYRNKTIWESIKMWLGYKLDLGIYEETCNDDDLVKYGKPYLDVMLKYPMENWILRGELSGGSLKGSGNKNNPASKDKVNIKFFGLDIYHNNLSVRVSDEKFREVLFFLSETPERLSFEKVKTVFMQPFVSKEHLLTVSDKYFKENMIEGIVVRTLDSSFSAKVMNLEYDSKK